MRQAFAQRLPVVVSLAVVVFLDIYTAVGAVQAFNLFNASDRLARHYSRYPRILRAYRRDDPASTAQEA